MVWETQPGKSIAVRVWRNSDWTETHPQNNKSQPAKPHYRPAVKFRQINKATLARLQNKHEGDESHNSELEDEDEDEENDEGIRREENTGTPHDNWNEDGCQTTFAVDPNIDLNATALLDMISPEPTVSEKTMPTERPSKPANLERKISVAEAFESDSW